MNRDCPISTDVADAYVVALAAANAEEPYDHALYERQKYGLIDALRALFTEWPEPVQDALVDDALNFVFDTGEPVSHYVNWHLPRARVKVR